MMLRHRCSQRLKCVECIHTNQHHHHEDTQELKSKRKKIKYRKVRVTLSWDDIKRTTTFFALISLYLTLFWAKDKQLQVDCGWNVVTKMRDLPES